MRILDAVDRDEIARLVEAQEFFWLDLENPTPQELAVAAEVFALHELAVEDSVEFGQRPKLDEYGEHVLMVFYGVESQADAAPRLVEVHIYLSGDWLMTVHREPCSCLGDARGRLELGTARTEEEVVYRVLDALTDSFFPLLSALDDQIDELEAEVLEHASRHARERIFDLKRELVELRHVVTPQRDMLAAGGDLIERLPGLALDEAHDYFRDVYDHMIRISQQIDGHRELLTGLLDLHLSTVSTRLNEVMKQLTVVATIFLPLTFVTGIFGQNFGWMVDHIDGMWDFIGWGLGGLALAVAGMYTYFKRSGFFDA